MLIKLTDVDGLDFVFVEHSAIVSLSRQPKFETTNLHGMPGGIFIPERTRVSVSTGEFLIVSEMPQVIANMVEDARIGKVGSPDVGSR